MVGIQPGMVGRCQLTSEESAILTEKSEASRARRQTGFRPKTKVVRDADGKKKVKGKT